MKKNLYYMSLLLGLVFGVTMFTACGGDDDDNTASSSNNGSASGSDAGGIVPGKFMGPKRVFGDNLLSSYGGQSGGRELIYNSDGFVTSIKPYSIDANNQKNYSGNDYEVTYSGNQVIVNRNGKQAMLITIGSNGFAETVDWGKETTTYEYDSEGHVTRFTSNRDYIGTLTWHDGNMIKPSDNDAGINNTRNIFYNSTPNVAGLYVRASIGGDVGDFYDDMLYYLGLLGKGTANLVQSYNYSYSYSSGGYTETHASESINKWTLDAAGRPTQCVTTTLDTDNGSSSTRTSTYFWTYR